MKKLTTGKVIVEQTIKSTSYLAIPKEHFDSQGWKPKEKVYVSVVTIAGLRVLQYSKEKSANSIEKSITGFGGYYRVSIPKKLIEKYPHGKGSRYEAYTSAMGSLVYEQLKES